MLTFVDTSALLRLLFTEGDVTPVVEALGDSASTSRLTELEVRVSIHRRRHANVIDDTQAEACMASAGEMFSRMLQLDLTEEVRAEAAAVAARFPLRTLDAVQLGAAGVSARTQRRHGGSMSFLTADRRQADVARELFGDKRTILLDPL